jgi:hypothetical protein
LRQNLVELTKPYEWLATDDRYVQWLVTIDELHKTVHKLFTFVIADLIQQHTASEVLIAIRIASRTA